jgi:non-canonical poly(A) RNA polymerase PAPD5/7
MESSKKITNFSVQSSTTMESTSSRDENTLRLHHEVQRFYVKSVPTPIEHAKRINLISRVENVILDILPSARVDFYGSYRSGLYLSSSDVDIVVNDCCADGYMMTNIKVELIRKQIAETVVILANASVPIIKIKERGTQLKVDICFNIMSGVHSAQMIKSFKKRFPALPKLVLVVKQFLRERKLNATYSGGISSLSLTLMIIRFLQQEEQNHKQSDNLGSLLLKFLKFYGHQFDFLQLGISVNNGGSFIPKEELQQTMTSGPSVLCIEDPLTPGNNIGRSSFNAAKVFDSFKEAYLELFKALSPNNGNRNILSSILRGIDVTNNLNNDFSGSHENGHSLSN